MLNLKNFNNSIFFTVIIEIDIVILLTQGVSMCTQHYFQGKIRTEAQVGFYHV